MTKRVYLREYPKGDEPSIFNGWNYDPTLIKSYRSEIIDFFQNKLGLVTTHRSIEGKEYIEGSFLDKDNRKVSLRFFIKGCYKNVLIEGDEYIRTIRTFKTLYRESPYIYINNSLT